MQTIDKKFLDLVETQLSDKQLTLLGVSDILEVEGILGKTISDARAELFVLLNGIDDSETQEKIVVNYKLIQEHRKNLKDETLVAKKSEIVLNSNSVTIYCDGGCSPNPGESGSGVAIYLDGKVSELWYGLNESNGTNNSAELHALYESLVIAQKVLEGCENIEIKCDSMYSINCIKTWAKSWEKNGWKKKGGAIKNLDIIKESYYLYNQLSSKVKLSYIKAHAGAEGNELADRMTQYARIKQEKEFVKYDKEIDIDAILAM